MKYQIQIRIDDGEKNDPILGSVLVDQNVFIDTLAVVLRYTKGVDDRLARCQDLCRILSNIIGAES